jgi:Fur family ferric uptake transcriptional regulator
MTITSIKKLLKTRNLRVTELRVALLEIISNLGKAVSYQEIQNSLIKFDRITLYRTLNTFIDRGILHKIILEDNKNFYALCNLECTMEKHQHQHIHFQCNQCKEVSCLESKEPIKLGISNHLVDQIAIMASGLCQDCYN